MQRLSFGNPIQAAALALPALQGVTPKKVIVVKGRLVNVVS